MITIRNLNLDDDLGEVLVLCKEFFLEYECFHDDFFDTDNMGDDDISGKFVDSLNSENSATIIALDDKKIVGYASIAVSDQSPFYKIKKVGHISALMVLKDYRRQGIATRVLSEAKRFFRIKNIKYYTFYTAVGNRAAVKLYEKLGMTPLHTSFLGET